LLARTIVIYTDWNRSLNQVLAYGDSYGLSPICRAELAESGSGVRIDGSFGDTKNLSDLPSRLACRRPGKHFLLARRELRSLIRWPA
jgi:hypothetical protein